MRKFELMEQMKGTAHPLIVLIQNPTLNEHFFYRFRLFELIDDDGRERKDVFDVM